MSEVLLNDETIKRFRARYTATFGGNTVRRSALWRDQRRAALPGPRALAAVLLRPSRSARATTPATRPSSSTTRRARRSPTARRRSRTTTRRARTARTDKKLRPRRRALQARSTRAALRDRRPSLRARRQRAAMQLSPFALPDERRTEDAGGRIAPQLRGRAAGAGHQPVRGRRRRCSRPSSGKKRHSIVACWSDGSRDRMAQVLGDHGLRNPRLAENWQRRRRRPRPNDDGAGRAAARERLRDRRSGRPLRAGHSRRAPAAPAATQEGVGCADRGDEPRSRRSRGACRPRHRPLPRPQADRGDGRAA